jgi:acyl-[acyl-carrier-protein]-phospholipid O-acyltransferase / long-chain-fatty-acid--[acyl-carrier-protein] ligase
MTWFIRIVRWLIRSLYGFKAWNEEVLRTPGPVLLLSNHLSWWDWLFIGACLEADWRFVTSSTTAKLTKVHRWIMVNHRTFSVDMNSPYAVKHIADYLHHGGRLVLFPEGRMSTTGSLMKLFEGTGFLVSKTHARIITAYLRGAGRLPFSRNPNRKEWFPRVSAHFSEVLNPPRADHTTSVEVRHAVTRWLRDQMLQQQFETEMRFGPSTIFQAIEETVRKNRKKTILQDSSLQTLSYGRLLTAATVLAQQWKSGLSNNDNIGVLLPNMNVFPVVLLSLWMNKLVPAVLNYTSGPATLASCAKLAGLKKVLTSRKFLERSKLDPKPMREIGVELIYLEDVRAKITWLDRIRGAVLSRRRLASGGTPTQGEDTALILFTSGSEGEPKGVALSHNNILANVRQMVAMIDLLDSDRLFNALPLFHSFGLTIGLILPLMQGNFVFLYLSPLHYRIIPAALYHTDATVFFGTNTFLAAYARKAHPYDFHTVRYVFAGAEKLQASTTTLWMEHFGIRILEGYGTTECSPCVTVNVPMQAKPGSAGRFLPAIQYRLEPVEGIDAASLHLSSSTAPHSVFAVGRLWVRGPNIMRGYLNPDANARVFSGESWYDTGDIAGVDHDGFLFILGRLKRFAKVSGEMISLGAIEEILTTGLTEFGPKLCLAVVTRPDEAKGEQIVLVTNEPKLSLERVREAIRAKGMSNLSMPRELRVLHELPLLGSGKVNHRELERLIRSTPNA